MKNEPIPADAMRSFQMFAERKANNNGWPKLGEDHSVKWSEVAKLKEPEIEKTHKEIRLHR